ncbi:MAG: cation-translocating P-type ATPase [Firmicutes bacterium]|nr:cation-translocating P-type ATPase [Bacillota bacterium]
MAGQKTFNGGERSLVDELENYGSKNIEEVVNLLDTNLSSGLSREEAERRLAIYGRNQLIEEKPRGFLAMFFDQFKDFLVLILIASTVIAALMGELLDAAVIMSIVILNAVLGVIQEGRAERALAALRRMAVPEATVLRDGRQIRVPSSALVPGDVVLLQAGDVVPADLRLVETVNLKTDESPLTGESVPVEKHADVLVPPEAALGDRPNQAFLGTTVVYGRGRGVVARTGMKTELGKIAALVASVEEVGTPLQRKLEEFGRWLGLACLGICLIVFILGILRGGELLEMFMTAGSLAVAAIPEGLPAMVTIVLALGVQRMIARNAIIRRLPAVETLGCATYVCSDKTGTLTENKMTVTELFLARGEQIAVSGRGYEPRGEFIATTTATPIDPLADPDLRVLLEAALACNDAELVEEEGRFEILGDPTEGALVVLAAKAGMSRERLAETLPRLDEIPFDSTRKRMTTVHRRDGQWVAFTKGAPDILLELCHHYREKGEERPLSPEKRREYHEEIGRFAGRGLRVLGLAYKSLPPGTKEGWDEHLTFLGLVAMQDPVRAEAKAAVATCLRAGIKPVMITGDYAQTARAIAAELGMAEPEVFTGAQIEAMSDRELEEALGRSPVFARVSPEHKLRIVEALRRRGEVVAMTGDGVNDAPALRSADIGVAMGIAGTEVAKGASDMVLADDNFATIVAAIEEGRVIFENIRKAVIYLLSCNIGELLLFFLAILGGLPGPMVPVQILLINLVTDGLPALALGVEPKEENIMDLPPRDPKEGILNRTIVFRMFFVGSLMGIAALVPFVFIYRRDGDLALARTAAFTTLAFAELWRVLASRSERRPWWRMPFFGNPQLILAILSSALIILAVLYLPPVAGIFQTVVPKARFWEVVLPMIFVPMLGAEVAKRFGRRKNHPSHLT